MLRVWRSIYRGHSRETPSLYRSYSYLISGRTAYRANLKRIAIGGIMDASNQGPNTCVSAGGGGRRAQARRRDGAASI